MQIVEINRQSEETLNQRNNGQFEKLKERIYTTKVKISLMQIWSIIITTTNAAAAALTTTTTTTTTIT